MQKLGFKRGGDSGPALFPTEALRDEGEHQGIEGYPLCLCPRRKLSVYSLWNARHEFPRRDPAAIWSRDGKFL